MRIIGFLLFALLLSSCDKDDSCTDQDWIGTYSGIGMCDGEPDENVTIVVEAGSSENQVIFDGEPVNIDNCKIETSETIDIFGTIVTVSISYTLDGNTISGTATSSTILPDGSTEETNCSLSVSK